MMISRMERTDFTMPKESDFHAELRKDLAEDGVTLAKVPDAPASYTMKDDGSKVRFSPPKFVDLVGVGPCEEIPTDKNVVVTTPFGRPLFWECKLMTRLNSFPLSRIEPNQLRILLELADRSSAFFVINYRVKNYADRTIKNLGLHDGIERKRINAVVSIEPRTILQAVDAGKKSLPIKELSQSFIFRPWGGRWHYLDIFKSLWRP